MCIFNYNQKNERNQIMKNTLSVENLNVSFPYFDLKNVSFSCSKGEIIGIIGANGAGKSTTIKAILGIIKKRSGKIFFNGKELTAEELASFRDSVGYVGDVGYYYPNIKVKKILNFVSNMYSEWDYQKANELIEKFGINTSKAVKELSTGMKMKLDLVLAMSHNAEIYIMDEPTSGLDPLVRREVLNILYSLAKNENRAIIFSSHITSDLERIIDRAIYMVDGAIVMNSKVEDLRNNYIRVNSNQVLDKSISNLLLNMGEYCITQKDRIKEYYPSFDYDSCESASLEDILFYLGGH